MIAVLDLNAELAKLAHFARTPTSPEAERKKGLARLAPCRDGSIFTNKFSGTGGWKRHPNGDEIVYVLEGATMPRSITGEGPQEQELRESMMVVVPQGMWHRFESRGRVTLMSVTPLPTDHPEIDVEDPR